MSDHLLAEFYVSKFLVTVILLVLWNLESRLVGNDAEPCEASHLSGCALQLPPPTCPTAWLCMLHACSGRGTEGSWLEGTSPRHEGPGGLVYKYQHPHIHVPRDSWLQLVEYQQPACLS